MKTRHLVMILALTLVMAMGFAVSANAESNEVTGYCYFNGDDIVCDFDSDIVVKTVSGLEPGDDVTFKVKFENKYKELTHWYMRNEALITLEESFDRSQNGGYTYKLVHIGPDGKEQVLFDNSEVGGDAKPGNMEGLHQATNALDEWFYIQDLKQGQSGYTQLYVKFDGDSEVNDYMDTAGKLLVAYAVELDSSGNSTGTVTKKTSIDTGDSTGLLTHVTVLLTALLMLIFSIMSFRKDRRMSSSSAGAGQADSASMAGKERD